MYASARNRPRTFLTCIGIAAAALIALTAITAGPAGPATAGSFSSDPPLMPPVSLTSDAGTGVETGGAPIALPLDELRRSGAAEQCTSIDAAGTQSCVSLGEPVGKDSKALGSPAQPQAVVGLPQWCIDAGVSNTYYVSRFDACGIFNGTLTVTSTTNGVTTVTGIMNFLIYNYLYTSGSLTTWANQIEVQPSTISGTAAGTTITGTPFCTGSCVYASSSFPAQTPGVGVSASGESYYNWLGASGDVGFGSSDWTLRFKAPSTANAAVMTRSAPDIRCDQALPGSASAGCVVPYAPGFIRYDGTSFIEFGAHVSGAQASGLPGSVTSSPLHRLTDPTLRNLNRATACGGVPHPDPNRSCDEYPFASSWEGAYTGGGTARTQSWCQITLSGPPSTGATGYSICMIDAAENSSAGSLLNSVLYVPYRIIDGDPFYVDIV